MTYNDAVLRALECRHIECVYWLKNTNMIFVRMFITFIRFIHTDQY